MNFLNFVMSHTKIFHILKYFGVIFIFNVQKPGQYYFVGWILKDFLCVIRNFLYLDDY